MRTFSLVSFISLASLASTFACKHTETPADSDPDTKTASSSLLRRAESCEDLTQALQDDARARLARIVDQQWRGAADGGWSGFGGSGPVPGAAGASSAMGGATASGGTISGDPGGEQGPQVPGSYTGTNTQVAGVDEADIVKTDGQNIYVLRNPMPDANGTVGAPELVVARAWPVEQAAVSARATIEGTPIEMFVTGEPGAAESKVVVYSTVDGTALYGEAGLALPQANYGYPVVDCWDCSYYGAPVTKLTLLALRNGALSLERELYYEGNYISARRVMSMVRTSLGLFSRAPALRTYPNSADEQRAEMLVLEQLIHEGRSVADISNEELSRMIADRVAEVLVLENEAAISAITHEDWRPRVFVRTAAGVSYDQLECTDFYLPQVGSGEGGVTSIALLDLDAPSNQATGAAIVGLSDTMYQNASALVMAAQEWTFVPEPGGAQQQTVLHAFDVSDPQQIVYQASGEVPGFTHGQFAIDERDGVLRVATTESDATGLTTNRISLLQADGADLGIRGAVTGLAPGETVSAVRWIGDKGYVVTRIQARDPLFVVNVADPTAPVLLGALPITGFSEYLHPLDDQHLLAIGRAGDTSGVVTGNVTLRIYDVTDPAAPVEEHVLPFEETGDSLAEANHKAFTYYAEQSLLAVPFTAYSYDEYGYYRTNNSIELFHVSVDEGLSKLGRLDANVLLTPAERGEGGSYCNYYGEPVVERGLFIEETLYAAGDRGIIAADVANPSEPLAVLEFQPDASPYGCSSTGGVSVGGAGGAWVGGSGGAWAGGAGGSVGGASGGAGGAMAGGSAGAAEAGASAGGIDAI